MKLTVEERGDLLYWILGGEGPVLTLGRDTFRELAIAVSKLGDVKGVVLTSDREGHFCAGADIGIFDSIRTEEEGAELSREGQALLRAIEEAPVPIVAAIPGLCLGGGMELVLACHARVVAEGARLGLPEVRVGILPGLGGTERLPRLVGLASALPLLLSGKTVDAKRARRIGLVDAVAPQRNLLRAAEHLVRDLPRRRPARLLLGPLFKALARRRLPGGFEAPRRVLRAIGRGEEHEAKEFGRAVVSPESRHLVRLFHAASACKRGADDPLPRRAGILGFGKMGAGIASALTRAGVEVRVRDRDDEALKNGLRRFDGDPDRLTLTTDWTGFEAAEVMIEAVPEDLRLKRRVLAEAKQAAPEALLFSNTSSLSVTKLCVVGLHFFNPVRRMPLVEVVAGRGASPAAVRRARSLAVALKKVPVVVQDVPGFLVNRILGRYLAAAAALDATEDAIDAGARAHGFPMGPFEVLDMVGHDVARAVAAQLRKAYGERFESPERFRKRKRRRARPADIAPALAALHDEAQRCWAEGVADGESIDLACVMGFGYPAWRGSLLDADAASARRAG